MLSILMVRLLKWLNEHFGFISKLCRALKSIPILPDSLIKEDELAYTNYRQHLYKKEYSNVRDVYFLSNSTKLKYKISQIGFKTMKM